VSSNAEEHNLPDFIVRVRPTLSLAGRGSGEDVLNLIIEVTGEKKRNGVVVGSGCKS